MILAPIAARAMRGSHEPLLQNGTPRHIFPLDWGLAYTRCRCQGHQLDPSRVDAPQEIASVLSSETTKRHCRDRILRRVSL